MEIQPAGLARLLGAALGALGMGGLWLWVPVEDGWRTGTLAGAGLGTGASLVAFELRRRALSGNGKDYLIGLVGGLFMNLVFLFGGTILALYSAWLGHYLGYAFAYVGAVLLLKGVFTWALHRELVERSRR